MPNVGSFDSIRLSGDAPLLRRLVTRLGTEDVEFLKTLLSTNK